MGLTYLLHLAVQLETLGDLPGLLTDGAQHVDIHARGADAELLVWALEPRPPHAQPLIHLGMVALADLIVGLVGRQCEVSDILGLLFSHGTLLDQSLLVYVEQCQVFLDVLVQLGLCKHGLVHIIVPSSAVADRVNRDISPPLVPPLHFCLERTRHGNGFVAVEVEDEGPERLPQV